MLLSEGKNFETLAGKTNGLRKTAAGKTGPVLY